MNPGANKVCPQCGQHVPIDAAHCPFCGHAFRTQFVQPQPQYPAPPQPQYPPPNVVYVPVPMGSPMVGHPYPQRQNKQMFVKWLIGLTIVAILGVAVYAVLRSKLAPSGGQASVSGSTTPIVPTNMFDDKAATTGSKILIHWEKSEGGQTLASVTNEGPEMLPNLYVQFVLADDSSGEYTDPYQIRFEPPGQQPQDAIPPNQPVAFTIPYDFNQIRRLHAYFVESTPAGPIQYGLTVDQTQDQAG